ncbi:alpha/beta hydrolase [Motilimonas pumila]|uniref:Alpha/beta hydrolase n=1 Tax=Motilimonas pumila TaxID=2303987 RepID=A0A418YFV1_9GAMM|nr:alpha/beta hydrolase [Motilimonas pumila]RJG48423.1 alpha/beta hydrolase [Motilimonas pumila]
MKLPYVAALSLLTLTACNSGSDSVATKPTSPSPTPTLAPTTEPTPTTEPGPQIVSRYISQCDPALLEANDMTAQDTAVFSVLEGETVAQIEGVICDGSLEAGQTLFSQHSQLQRLQFLDVSGSIDDETNLKLAKLVHTQKIHTHVSNLRNKKDAQGQVLRGGVASGGTDLFLAGQSRSADKDAFIGVHSWSDGEREGKELPRDHEAHQPYIQYYQKIGLSKASEFYFFTLHQASTQEMHYLTPAELKQFSLLTE